MGRLISGSFFAMALLMCMLATGSYGMAGPQWCEEDPVFVVNGALLDVTTAIPANELAHLKGPMQFELLVPSNSVAAVVSLPSTIPATAKITKSLPATSLLSLSVPVVVKVTVSATTSFDTSTQVTGTHATLITTVWGKSNSTTKVSYKLLGL